MSKHISGVEALGFSKKADISYRFDVFLDCLEAALTFSPVKTDRHFRPQFINLGSGFFQLNYVAKIETLAQDLQKISDASGLKLPSIETIKQEKRNSSGSSSFSPNRLQRKKIETMFARDYELYGYYPPHSHIDTKQGL